MGRRKARAKGHPIWRSRLGNYRLTWYKRGPKAHFVRIWSPLNEWVADVEFTLPSHMVAQGAERAYRTMLAEIIRRRTGPFYDPTGIDEQTDFLELQRLFWKITQEVLTREQLQELKLEEPGLEGLLTRIGPMAQCLPSPYNEGEEAKAV